MRIAVDPVRCQRNGVCTRLAPEVFHLGPAGLTVVEEPPAPSQRAVEDAARRCPTRAIRVSS